MTAVWRYELVTHAGVPLCELPATGRTLTLARNAGGDAKCTLPLLVAGDPAIAPHIRHGEVDLLVSRDGRRLWRGPLMASDGTLGTETGDMTLAGVPIWETLEHRIIPPGREILATEATQIAWTLIDDAQAGPGRALGIAAGDLPNSVARSRTWDTPTPTTQAIQELADLDDGFDWSLTPQQQGVGDGWRFDTWWPRQGDHKDLVLEWGRNIGQVQWTVDAIKIANHVTARGSNQIPVTAQDATSQGLHRVRESEVSAGDVDDATMLGDIAAGAIQPAPVFIPRLTCLPGAVTLDDVGIGDTVHVRVLHGWLQIDARYRIEQIDITISDEGEEQLTIIVQEAAP